MLKKKDNKLSKVICDLVKFSTFLVSRIRHFSYRSDLDPNFFNESDPDPQYSYKRTFITGAASNEKAGRGRFIESRGRQ